MNKRILSAALAAMIVAGGLVTWTLGSAAGAGYNRVTMTGTSDSRYQRKQVDPIVNPGQPVSAHVHDEYCRIDFSSTMYAVPHSRPGFEADPGDIPPSYSTCRTYGDWPGWWVPNPLWNGVPLPPATLKTTWQAPDGTQVSVPPFGMAFVAGDSHATSEATISPNVRFTCGNIDGPLYTKPADCSNVTGGVVTGQITFPDCWDGTTAFDIPAGIAQGHFGYSVNGACPLGMIPCKQMVPMAQAVLQFAYRKPDGTPMVNPYNADSTLGLSFSSGPWYTLHGDYLNTSSNTLANIINACLNKLPYWTTNNRSSCPTNVNNVPIQ